MGASHSPDCGPGPAFKAQTPDDLRALIGQAERIVANLRGAGPEAKTLLHLFDAIYGLVASLKDTGIDLRAETTRLETVAHILQAKDAILLREMRSCGGLAAARKATAPAPERWWWYLDRRVAARRRRHAQRALIAAGGVAAALLIAWLLYHYVFPPDPRRMAAMDKSATAERLLAQGDLAGAADYYRQAAEITPEDAELHIWVGVLEAQQGHEEVAAAAFARAEGLSPDRASFLVARGTAWLQVGTLDSALADGEAALAARPDSAEAWLLLAGVYETRRDTQQAIGALEKAAELAEKAGNSTLVVMAKARLAMLLEAAPMAPAGTTTPAP